MPFIFSQAEMEPPCSGNKSEGASAGAGVWWWNSHNGSCFACAHFWVRPATWCMDIKRCPSLACIAELYHPLFRQQIQPISAILVSKRFSSAVLTRPFNPFEAIFLALGFNVLYAEIPEPFNTAIFCLIFWFFKWSGLASFSFNFSRWRSDWRSFAAYCLDFCFSI